jgi:tight adherence protein C
MTPITIALVFTAAVAVLAFLGVSGAVERADVRDSLRRLEGYQIPDVRDQEMLAPISERVLAPLVGGVTSVARHFTPAGYAETVGKRLILAGNPPGLDADKVLALKLLGIVSGVVWVPLVFVGLHAGGVMGLAVVALLWICCALFPDVMITRKIEDRQHAIAVKLPDILDLLVISVEAGLGFEQALDRTATSVPGPLSEEFTRMLREIRIGSSRADALRALDERTDVPELRTFILAMLQADTFGVSISKMLRAQADEMRVHRRLRAQEAAMKLPVKMLFPMVFCIFPSVFVIILGPAFIAISRTL